MGVLEQAARLPTISAIVIKRRSGVVMVLILLEALLALVVLVAIVWWTMFSGRKGGELPSANDLPSQEKKRFDDD